MTYHRKAKLDLTERSPSILRKGYDVRFTAHGVLEYRETPKVHKRVVSAGERRLRAIAFLGRVFWYLDKRRKEDRDGDWRAYAVAESLVAVRFYELCNSPDTLEAFKTEG